MVNMSPQRPYWLIVYKEEDAERADQEKVEEARNIGLQRKKVTASDV